MRKLLILLLPLFLFGCASVTPSRDKLDYNGNYIDKSFTHTITVTKTDSLSSFGVTSKEWEELFNDSLIYKAYGKGNGYMSQSEVKQFTYDAIKITAKNSRIKFFAITEGQINSKTMFIGQSSTVGSITTHNYSPIEKYDFSCYAIMFDSEDLVPLLREAFGRVQIFSAE